MNKENIEEEKIEEESKEEEVDLSEYEQEQLEDFRNEIEALKAKEVDKHIQDVNTEYLGKEEHELWKFYKKFTKEGWPEIRVTEFERKLNHYSSSVLMPLANEKGRDEEVRSKDNFQAYLRTKVIVEAHKDEINR